MKHWVWICIALLILSNPLESYRIQSDGRGRVHRKQGFERNPINHREQNSIRRLPVSDVPVPATGMPYRALAAIKRFPQLSNITKEIDLPSNKSNEEDLFSIGYMHMGWISNVKGLDGDVKMHLVSNLIDNNFLNNNTKIFLRSPRGKTLKPFRIQRSVHHMKTIHVLKLKGVTDVGLAGLLKRHAVYVRQADVPPLEEDEFLERHILGMQVYVNTSGVVDPMPFGRVTRTYTPEELCRTRKLAEIMHGVIEIHRYDNGLFSMIPFTDEFIPTMDVQRRFMIIEPWEDMLDITFANPKRKKQMKQSREMHQAASNGGGSDGEEVEDAGSNPFFVSERRRPPEVKAKPEVTSPVKPDRSAIAGELTKTEKRRMRAVRTMERRATEKLNRSQSIDIK